MRARSRQRKVGDVLPPKQIRPKSLADYLEVLSRIAFEAGLSSRVIEANRIQGHVVPNEHRVLAGESPEPRDRTAE